ncbi:maleate cis-trans isomerase [Streptomyces sp. NPDC005708]|uniref:maleate cis-trans isomerase family protein n=1 Tax=Streptomyces sp. NPDC005708 TaxID=3154564 RepID=UPI0033CE36FC
MNAQRADIRFDAGRHYRARLGFVLLAMEQTVESEVLRLLPPGVGAHFTRAPMANQISVDTLRAMAGGIGDAAALILPDEQFDVICYACTSGSVVIGEDRIFAELRRGAPAAHPTSLITSVMAAFRALDARKITVATPYVEAVNDIEREYLEGNGFDVLRIEGLGLDNDADMVRVAPDYLAEFARQLDHPDSDALFISCSALRSIEIIDDLETEIGKPVITSNQAMLWNCLRLAGIEDRLDHCGQLLRDF